MRTSFIAALAAMAVVVADAADEPLVRGDFTFDGMTGMLGWEAPETKGGAASAAAADTAGPDGKPVVRFTGKAESCKLVSMPVGLAPGDTVLCRIDVAGRHFGMRVSEEIEEN